MAEIRSLNFEKRAMIRLDRHAVEVIRRGPSEDFVWEYPCFMGARSFWLTFGDGHAQSEAATKEVGRPGA